MIIFRDKTNNKPAHFPITRMIGWCQSVAGTYFGCERPWHSRRVPGQAIIEVKQQSAWSVRGSVTSVFDGQKRLFSPL